MSKYKSQRQLFNEAAQFEAWRSNPVITSPPTQAPPTQAQDDPTFHDCIIPYYLANRGYVRLLHQKRVLSLTTLTELAKADSYFEKFIPENCSSNSSSIVHDYEKRKRYTFSRRKYSKHNDDTHYDVTSPLPQRQQHYYPTDIQTLIITHPDAVLTYTGEQTMEKHAHEQDDEQHTMDDWLKARSLRTCPHHNIQFRGAHCPLCTEGVTGMTLQALAATLEQNNWMPLQRKD